MILKRKFDQALKVKVEIAFVSSSLGKFEEKVIPEIQESPATELVAGKV